MHAEHCHLILSMKRWQLVQLHDGLIMRRFCVTGAVEALDKATLEKLAGGDRDKDTMVVLYAPWCPFCQALEDDYETVAREIGGESLHVAKYNADADREYAQTLGLKTFPTLIFLPNSSDKVRHTCIFCGDDHVLEVN
jgi:thiol-disulfide isomerase/thioredoxin